MSDEKEDAQLEQCEVGLSPTETGVTFESVEEEDEFEWESSLLKNVGAPSRDDT
jgi:hypothetical protein